MMNLVKKKEQPLSSSLPTEAMHTWNECHHIPQQSKKGPFIIGVAGGTASGKTTVCDSIIKQLGANKNRRVAIISQDSFYNSLGEEERKAAHSANYNFDHPAAFDWKLIESTLRDLSFGKAVTIPEYDFVSHSRLDDKGTNIYAVDIILFEGILAFYQPEILQYMDMKIFVDTDSDIRLARRILRDLKDRGRDVEGILHQYQKFVMPAFEEYILPTKKYADVIIPRGADNIVAINLIVQHVRTTLEEKEREKHAPVHHHFGSPRSEIQFELDLSGDGEEIQTVE